MLRRWPFVEQLPNYVCPPAFQMSFTQVLAEQTWLKRDVQARKQLCTKMSLPSALLYWRCVLLPREQGNHGNSLKLQLAPWDASVLLPHESCHVHEEKSAHESRLSHEWHKRARKTSKGGKLHITNGWKMVYKVMTSSRRWVTAVPCWRWLRTEIIKSDRSK